VNTIIDDLFEVDTPPSWDILAKVENELQRQDELWGEQNHPFIGGTYGRVPASDYEWAAEYWKVANANRVEQGSLGWDGILLAEVYEALSEADPEKQVEELVQVAAVAINMALSIKRNAQVVEIHTWQDDDPLRASATETREKIGAAIAEAFRRTVEQGHKRAMLALGLQPESRTGWEWIEGEEGERLSSASEGPHPAVLVTLAGM
jgi:hypothetical protein